MDTYLNQLNPSQREAVLHTDGPLIIFAGAGTGKTRVITYRIAHLLGQGASPFHILAVTFTNKAAGEMRQRVDALVPGRGRSVWISTFHSFGAQFLRVEAKNIGLNPEFLIYDDGDQKKIIQECVRQLNLDEKQFKTSRILEVISRAKDEMLDADSYAIHSLTNGDPFRQAVATIYHLYQRKLKAAGALDFGDLLMVTVQSLRDNKELLARYQERFRYVLVDEYQDTNHAQYLLTKYLAGKHKNICVVGDDDQSIYSWRGADIRNILEFERDYANCRIVKLEQNYRSTTSILTAAWQVIKNNQKRVNKKVWTENAGGAPVNLVEVANELDEAQWIANRISRIRDEENRSLRDFAVFYRTNAQSRVFEDACRRGGIPYRIVGSVRFYERAEVKDLLAYLRLVHNPHDNVSFRRVVNEPRRGIGKTSMESLDAFALERGLSLWGALEHLSQVKVPEGARKSFTGFRNLIAGVREGKDAATVKAIASAIIEKTGYIRALETEDTPEAKNRIENIQEFISAIDEFEQRSPDKTLAGYLTQVSLVSDLDNLVEGEDTVTLMTLHLAKGLEFRIVFVTGLEEGLFPIGETGFNPDDLEEERRLMYVGMTRAKEDLYLSWAAQRRVYGKTHFGMPSRFVEEAKAAPGCTKVLTAISRDESPCSLPSYRPTEPPRRTESQQPRQQCDTSPYPLGTRVKHPQFGEGKVIDKSGSGDDLKLVVLFDTGQWKKLLVKYANLQKIA